MPFGRMGFGRAMLLRKTRLTPHASDVVGADAWIWRGILRIAVLVGMFAVLGRVVRLGIAGVV
ncbi:MAG: hypothetical protein NZM37_08375 [Sandaracinaceae bacterium]|nr:hypothetical protein [Sandaracinaceae bacterium]MDW8246013.1 hypothetical protein [Sandaracinaceae bacterium]